MRAEKMNELVRTMKSRNIMEKLANAKNKVEVFEEEETALGGKLDDFRKLMKGRKKLGYKYTFYKGEYPINPKNVLEICLICIMVNMDDCRMFQEYTEIPKHLRGVKGKWKYVAANIAYCIGENDEGDLFSNYSKEELLKKFFYK